jgi:glycosyltransferase involved in cell wall biosynthesis
MSTPLVSIILPVYNGADCVGEAVDSMLRQTFRDFELIAIDDGSTKDDTASVLDALARANGDDRLRVVHLERNRGLAGALNHGISLARGRYIARQDHDDVSLPGRLEAQVQHLEAYPRCGLVGTRAEIWIGNTPTGGHHDHPPDNATLQFDLLTGNPFVHSSVMIRRSALDTVGVYSTDDARQPPEDYELWSRIARQFEIANLPERLVIYREMPRSLSRVGPNPFLRKRLLISTENLRHASGGEAPMNVCRDAAALAHAAYDSVSSDCDIRAVCHLVDAAARRIEAHNPGADLAVSRKRMIWELRDNYAAFKGGPLWNLRQALRRMPVIGPAGRRLKAYLRRPPWSSGETSR